MTALLEYEVLELLQGYGIRSPKHRFARSLQEVVQMAEEVSFPVVMKIVSPDILHKTDVGGVRVGIRDALEVEQTYSKMMEEVACNNPAAHLEGILISSQVPEGLEVIIGVTQDKTFGKVLMFGLGGVFVEVLRDVTFRAIPIRKNDAIRMITGIKNCAVLSGWRGQKAVDINQLADILCKVSQLVCEHPEIEEMDLNPVRIVGGELFVLDGKIILKPTHLSPA